MRLFRILSTVLPTLVGLLGVILACAVHAQQPAATMPPQPGAAAAAAAPIQTYPAPAPAYPSPSQASPAPAQAYPAPNQVYPTPAQGYPAPNPAYPVPAQTYPSPSPTYPAQYPPQSSGYPPPPYPYPGAAAGYPGQPQAGYPQGAAPQPPQSHFFRDLFAQTIAAVLHTSTGGLFSAITGRIMDWFTRKGANPANAAAYPSNGQYPQYGSSGYATPPGYPSAPATAYGTQPPAYPGQATTYPNAAQPAGTYPGATGSPAPGAGSWPQVPGYPSATQPAGNYPGASAYPPAAASSTAAYPSTGQPQGMVAAAAPALIYDARTGQPVPASANPYATRGLGMEGTLYAGIAYEVHIADADGTFATPINPATHDFHTGDKFMLFYRPSLPGRMEIYNINAAGTRTLIDSSNMAAGAMVGLGPYQFTNESGDESLLLVLSPCSTPQLLTATRDIVKVDATGQAAQTNAVQLGTCGAPTARGVDVQTRNIEKVALEGTTSFALDPVSLKELKSGRVTPREIPIVFHHR